MPQVEEGLGGVGRARALPMPVTANDRKLAKLIYFSIMLGRRPGPMEKKKKPRRKQKPS